MSALMAAWALAVSLALAPAPPARLPLGPPDPIADGVDHFVVTDPAILDPPGPLVVHLVRLDPAKVELTADLALGDRQGRGPVLDAARRRHAIAAVNAGFFALGNGDPTGVLRIDGLLVSDVSRPRAAVAIGHDRRGRPTLTADLATVAADIVISGAARPVRLAGIDTTRTLGGLVLFTPRYGADTGTAPTGVEWVIGRAPRGGRHQYVVRERRERAGRSAIPRDGAVLSYGGDAPPPPLDWLTPGREVRLREQWVPGSGRAANRWREADDVVGGAGLLMRAGRPVTTWAAERVSDSFLGRHPRTMVGADRAGALWLVVVDGRQPESSLGMTLVELQRLAQRLDLVEAVNLDGGGSTTLVAGDRVINRPSDSTGPRSVSDVLLVLPRPGPRPGGRR